MSENAMINLASKYADKVDERFHQRALTAGAFQNDYEWTGVKSIKVYSIDTVPLVDYQRSGTARFGQLTDLGDSLQEMIVGQDKAFNFVIDKGDNGEQLNVKDAGKALRRELDEVIIPHIDKYRFAAWAQGAGTIKSVAAAPDKDTIIDLILDGGATLDNKLVPGDGRRLWIGASLYKALKRNPDFIGLEALGTKALAKGQVGEVDGMMVTKVPDSWLPEGVYFMITHRRAALAPVKLSDYRLQKDPMGISGTVVEGRVIFDAFVLGSKADGIYVAAQADKVLAAPKVQVSGTTATITSVAGQTYRVTTDGSDPRYSASAQVLLASGTSTAVTVPQDAVVKVSTSKDGLFGSGVTQA